jgi:hypothetical protein
MSTILPVKLMFDAEMIAPVALTCPTVLKLPLLMLPVTLNNPDTKVPVLLTVSTLAVPAELIVTLAFELTTTFDVPDDIELAM